MGSRLAKRGSRPTPIVLGLGSLLAMLILAGTAFSVVTAYRHALDHAEANLRSCAQLVAEETARALQGVDLELQSIDLALRGEGIDSSEGLSRIAGTAAIHKTMQARASVLPQLGTLSLLNADGWIVNASFAFPPPPIDASQRDYFPPLRDAANPEALYLSPPMVSQITGRTGLHMGRRISSADGRFIGVALGGIDLDYFRKVFADAWSGPGSRVRLWRADGTLLLKVPQDIPDQPTVLSDMIHRGDAGVRHVIDKSGERRLAVAVALPVYPVVVTLSQSENAALAAWRDYAITIGVAGMCCAALVLLLSALLVRQFASYEAVKQSLRAQDEAVRGRRLAEDQLRQAQKMEAIGQLTAGIAHDFNNLLMSIFGSVDELERVLARAGVEPRRPLSLIRQSADRAAALTRQLLAFARQQILQPRAVILADVLDGMSDLLRTSMGAAIDIQQVLPDGLWPVYADPAQIEHVVLNLAINARDAMAQGGILRITAANILADAQSHPTLPPGRYVELVVQDNGSGMAPGTLARAMDPFFTTKPVGKGSGLGLSQVYGIVRQSGGGVLLNSVAGQGTKVTVLLPQAAMPAVDIAQPVAPIDPARLTPTARGTVLVVDDSALICETLLQTLQARGFQAIAATGGAVALEMLRDDPSIAALLIDVVMPGMDGIELARRARGLRPAVPILFMTGYANSDELRQEKWILQKPFRATEVVEYLRAALQEKPEREVLLT